MTWTVRESILSSAQVYLRRGETENPTPAVIAGLIYLGCLEDAELTRSLVMELEDPKVRSALRNYIAHVIQQEAEEQVKYAQAHINHVQLRLIRGRKT
jgi:hypothetical protein